MDGGHGFCDLNYLNQALLAKQLWRLHHGDGSLLHRVLDPKYFKKVDVIEAYRGYIPSFTWRSMWGAKALLKEGIIWRVGNGEEIKVRSDPWIYGSHGVVHAIPNPLHDPSMLVSHLIDHDLRCWDKEVVENLFDEALGNKILGIPFSLQPCNCYWWPNKHGVYSMKSAYLLAKFRPQGYAGNGNEQDLTWKRIWNMDCPPKMKSFLWRACNGCLPVIERLQRRHVCGNAQCPICGEEDKTI